jgi:hypothetical protein
MSRFEMPGAWYDLSCRLSAALAVIEAIGFYMPWGEPGADLVHKQLESVDNMAEAARDLLKLAKADCDALEQAFIALDPPGAASPPANAPGIPT